MRPERSASHGTLPFPTNVDAARSDPAAAPSLSSPRRAATAAFLCSITNEEHERSDFPRCPRARRKAYSGRSPADKGETRSCESPAIGQGRSVTRNSLCFHRGRYSPLARLQKRLGIERRESARGKSQCGAPRANTGYAARRAAREGLIRGVINHSRAVPRSYTYFQPIEAE